MPQDPANITFGPNRGSYTASIQPRRLPTTRCQSSEEAEEAHGFERQSEEGSIILSHDRAGGYEGAARAPPRIFFQRKKARTVPGSLVEICDQGS
jgi:hypothetical protein